MADYAIQQMMVVPVTEERVIDEVEAKRICTKRPWCDRKGVYIFFCDGDRPEPVYVGKTVKQTFYKEAFTSDKRVDVNDYLRKHPKCRLGLLTVVRRKKSSSKNKFEKQVGRMEKCLTFLANARNNKIKNEQNTRSAYWCMVKDPSWEIEGAIPPDLRVKRGRVARFRKMFGLNTGR